MGMPWCHQTVIQPNAIFLGVWCLWITDDIRSYVLIMGPHLYLPFAVSLRMYEIKVTIYEYMLRLTTMFVIENLKKYIRS